MPLKIGVEHKAVLTILRSVELLKDSIKRTCEGYKKEESATDMVADSLRMLYPSDYDLENEDAQVIVNGRFQNRVDIVYEQIAEKMFLVHNGKIFLREEMLEDYNLYSTLLDTYPFFASFLLKKTAELTNEKDMVSYVESYLDESFRFYGNIENHISEISDIHIHMGAVIDFHYRINNILAKPFDQRFSSLPRELFLHLNPAIKTNILFGVFSLIESLLIRALFFDELKEVEEDAYKTCNLLNKVLSGVTGLQEKEELTSLNSQYPSIRNDEFYDRLFDFHSDELIRGVSQIAAKHFDPKFSGRDVKYGDKALVLLFLISFKKAKENSITRVLVRAYFMMRNMTKAIVVQQHRRSGFGYFESYSSSSMKKGAISPKSILRSVLHPNLKTNIEGRVAVGSDVDETRNKIINFQESLRKINISNNSDHSLKYIYHFLKTKGTEEAKVEKKILSGIEFDSHAIDMLGKYCEPRVECKKQARILNQLFTNSSVRLHSFRQESDLQSRDKLGEITDLAANYIQGIDAANKEYEVPPEVFSGVYRFFKQSISSSGLALSDGDGVANKSISETNLQYSFHVGEEFRDIVSGVRSIFETVIFLGLKDEDRLGHAVALGIDPKVFLDERRQITLSQGEYFDNLIFLYYVFSQIENPPITLEVLKNKINRLSSKIYNSDMVDEFNFSVDDFIDAWLLRRNCPNEIKDLYESLIEDEDSLSKTKWKYPLELKRYLSRNNNALIFSEDSFSKSFIKAALPDFLGQRSSSDLPERRYMTAATNLNAFKIYGLYIWDSKVRKNSLETYKQNVIFDLDVYEFLQDHIMEDCIVKNNIYIEVLPTSNVLITSIGNYENHPFMRFKPPADIIPNKFGLRKNKIKILVGTDDPGIQGTNILMEYYHIKAIVDKKYGTEMAQDYVLDIIREGNYIFNKI